MLRLGFKYKDRIIFKNIFLISFGLPFLCVLMAGIIGFNVVWNNQLKEKERNVQDVLNVSRVMLENQLSAMENSMENLQNDVYVKRLLTRDAYVWDDDMNIAAKQIVNNIAINSDFHSIYLIGNGDYILKFTGPSYPLNKEADEKMVRLFYSMKYGEYKTYKYKDIYKKPKTIISLSRGELNSSDGTKNNGILISLDIGKVMDSMIHIENDGESYVLTDKEGQQVYSIGRNHEVLEGEQDPWQDFDYLSVFGTEEETLSSKKCTVGGITYLCSRVEISQGFYLYDFIPYETIKAPMHRIGLAFISILLLLAIVLLAISYVMSRWAYYPIDVVVNDARDQAPDRVPRQLQGTELEALATNYRYMMKHLNELSDDKELMQLADYLKDKRNKKKLPEFVTENYSKPGLFSRCLCFRMSDLEDFLRNNTDEAIAFMGQSIMGTIRQFLQKLGESLVVPIEQEYMAVFLFSDKSYEDSEIIIEMETLQGIIREMLQVSMDIGISSEKEGLSDLHDMYQMARAATAYRFLQGMGIVITEKMMAERALGNLDKPDTSRVLEMAKKSDKEAFETALLEVFDYIRKGSIQMAREVILGMAVDLQNYSNSLQYHFSSLSAQDYEKLSSELENYEYIDDLKNWFLLKAGEIWEVLSKAQKKGKEDIAEKAVAFLEQNYSDMNINAQYLADMYHITPSYFSRLFNDKTGYAFPDYLATLRIEKAKELLLENDKLSIQDVCDRVGYANPSYFTATFKKKFGITPGQFRKNKDITKN